MRFTKELRALLNNPELYAQKLRERVRKRGTRNCWWRLSPPEHIYCQVRNATGDDWAAFSAAFPDEHISKAAMKKRIYRLNCSRKVQRYTKELNEQFLAESESKYRTLKKQVLDIIAASINGKLKGIPTRIVQCQPEILLLCKIMGWNGPDAPDETRHSPQAMTEQEMDAYLFRHRFKRLRKLRKCQVL